MLDFAEVVVINKFERRGAEDALRDVRRQYARNRELFDVDPAELPVFGTVASRFNDDGVTALYQHLRGVLGRPRARRPRRHVGSPSVVARRRPHIGVIVPPARQRYLAEIAETVRDVPRAHRSTRPRVARTPPAAVGDRRAARAQRARTPRDVDALARRRGRPARPATSSAARRVAGPASPQLSGPDRPVRESLSGTLVPKLSLPRFDDARRARALAAQREPARPLPVHGRRVPVQARGRGPGAHVRRRGRPGAHQPPVQAAVRGPAGDPAVDRVRLGHAVRLRPGRAARHLRQGRQLRRVDRHPRRHEGAVRRASTCATRRRRCR